MFQGVAGQNLHLSSPCLGKGLFVLGRTQKSAPVKEPLASAASESKPSSALEGRSIAPVMAAVEKPAVSYTKTQPSADVASVAAAAPEMLAADAAAVAAPRQVEAAPAMPAPAMFKAAAPAAVSHDTEAAKPAVAEPVPGPAQPPPSFTPVLAAQAAPPAPTLAASSLRPNSFFAQAVRSPLRQLKGKGSMMWQLASLLLQWHVMLTQRMLSVKTGTGSTRPADGVRAAHHRHQGGDGAPPGRGRAAPPAEAGQDQQPADHRSGTGCCHIRIFVLSPPSCTPYDRCTGVLQAEAAADATSQLDQNYTQVGCANCVGCGHALPPHHVGIQTSNCHICWTITYNGAFLHQCAQGPLARMLGLLTSMWYWIKHHVESLLGQSTSTSSSAPSTA